MEDMNLEIEATFLAIEKTEMRHLLQRAGFVLKTAEYLMRRKTFDFSKVAPGKNRWGRVRQEKGRITMAIKEVVGLSIADTYEIELEVNSFELASKFFESCNIPEKSMQENFRELWTRESVEVAIDTWPGLNPFLEIEGPDVDKVKIAAADLGLVFERAVFGSIDLIYKIELGVSQEDIINRPYITFESPPQKS